MSQVRVRFAPSPTGFLHVGGARTAIFNWLFARRHDGVFILRIEDTDRARSSDEVVRAILDGMEWLGMKPDEGPFFQSEAKEKHVENAERLLATGHAYRCFCTPDAIKAERAEAEASGTTYKYPRHCVRLAGDESDRRAKAGEPFAIRFLVPEGYVGWDDLVHGATGKESDTIEDFVLVRSDGSPTYMLSVVSDDLAMGITHVIRGDDHLSNTPKQILLYRALERDVPAFAHIPLILGEDKKRLSKRHGALSVLAYRDEGYLPEAMFNFLTLLGWSPGDDREKLSRDELIDLFDLRGVGKSGAAFDLKKLEWLNGQYLREMPVESLLPSVQRELEAAGLWREEYAGERREWFAHVVVLLQSRARKLCGFAESGRPYFDPADDFPYDEKAARKHLGDGTEEHLRVLRERLDGLATWDAATIEPVVRGLVEELGVAAGKVIHPVRLAVTGRGESPGIFEVLELIGRERSLARIDRMLAHLRG